MTEQEQGLKIREGDLITIETSVVKICNLIVSRAMNHYDWVDKVRKDCWYIECHTLNEDGTHNPHYWKQDYDGGTVTMQEEVIN